ncbi:DNA repair protein RecO [Microbaculum marinum]|uniref:DNA repair protein RecO n=1 Tax=Microbaculum marinum TaxID=1764581 RepID=A0AAW9RXH1_9HYPH
MEWSDEGIILGVRRHGETSAIVELFTPGHGRHLGLVRGGRSRRMQIVLQPGNSVRATWRARLDEHLGAFAIEPAVSRAATLMESQLALYGYATLAAHLRLLPERDPHPELYMRFLDAVPLLADPQEGPQTIVRFELALLADLGFGLDLTECASTGERQDLVFVSPRSGRAVSRQAGTPYADRLLALPDFLRLEGAPAGPEEVAAGFALTGHFLQRHVFGARRIDLPPERDRLIRRLRS